MAEAGGKKPLRMIAEAFEGLAVSVNTNNSNVEVAPFSHACSLVSPLFNSLGIAFKFAEMDYVAKVADLEEASKSIMTLQALLDEDIQANTVQKRGSHTRNLLRVKRGLDMIKVLFEEIVATEGNSLMDAACSGYDKVFAPYHGWALRKAVNVGMYALPTRAQLLSQLNEDDNSAKMEMQKYVNSSGVVIGYIDKLFLSKELGIDW